MKQPLASLEEALAAILARAEPIQGVENVPLLEALGRVLAFSQTAALDVPPLDNSAMDGYALRYADLDGGNRELSVSQRIPAGHMGVALAPGTAARIFTGAAIPPSADTVVMQEDTELDGNIVRITGSVSMGQHVRPRGQDIASGSVVLEKGMRLRPQEIGLLASMGITEVRVFKRLKVAVLSTGDELAEPGQPLAEGQIYNSNRFTLSALLRDLGCDVIDGGIVRDDFAATCRQLRSLSETADLIISSGGVSVGEEDYVKAAVEALGELALWKINIKPGKPLTFGMVNNKPFFGLPGNPASVFVTFCLVTRAYILRCQGQQNIEPTLAQGIASFERTHPGSRQEYIRARVISRDGVACVELYPNQSSGMLASLCWANALVVIPPGVTVSNGDVVSLLMLSEFA